MIISYYFMCQLFDKKIGIIETILRIENLSRLPPPLFSFTTIQNYFNFSTSFRLKNCSIRREPPKKAFFDFNAI